jgi:glutaminyl-tRNA synthetase
VLEPAAAEAPDGRRVQFERQGYYWPDPEDSTAEDLVFNQIVPLRDTWGESDAGLSRQEIERRRRAKERQKERQRRRSLEGKTDPVDLLSDAQRERFETLHDEMGISREAAATIAGDDALAGFFRSALRAYDAPSALANWTVNELRGELDGRSLEALPFDAGQFATLVRLVDTEAITNRAARTVFEAMLEDGGDPEAIVEERGLRQVDDTEALRDVIADVLDEHPDEVERYRDGKEGLIGFFMGRVMEATGGSANPELARGLLREALEA